MGIHTADAIVLRHRPYRETSAFVSCLTERYGKIRGLIKGLRDQARPRFRSAMEPLTLNRIVFYDVRSGSLHLISQCELVDEFRGVSSSLETMRAACACVEVAEALIEAGDPHPEMFRLLRGALGRLSAGEEPSRIQAHTLVRLLRLAGFHPQLDECAGCDRVTLADGHWSVRQGGLLCAACLHLDPEAGAIDPSELSIMEACADSDLPPALTADEVRRLERRVVEFLQWWVDRPLKTLPPSTMAARTHRRRRETMKVSGPQDQHPASLPRRQGLAGSVA